MDVSQLYEAPPLLMKPSYHRDYRLAANLRSPALYLTASWLCRRSIFVSPSIFFRHFVPPLVCDLTPHSPLSCIPPQRTMFYLIFRLMHFACSLLDSGPKVVFLPCDVFDRCISTLFCCNPPPATPQRTMDTPLFV